MTIAEFPITIRLEVDEDRLSDPRMPGLVVDATSAALARAVDQAGQLRIVRHGALAATPARVTVRLVGDPLPADVAARLRTELARRARSEAARLLAGARRQTPIEERPASAGDQRGRAEAFDEERIVIVDETDDDRYLIPSYNGRGRNARVPITGGPAAGSADAPRIVVRLHFFETRAELDLALAQRFGGAAPSLVLLLSADRGGRPLASLLDLEPSGRVLNVRWMGRLRMFLPASDAGDAPSRDWATLRADRLEFDGDALTVADRRRRREELWIDRLVERGQGLTRDQVAPQARAIVRRFKDPGVPIRYYRLYAGSQLIEVIETDLTELPTTTIRAAVFTETYTTDAEQETLQCGPLPDLPLLGFDPDPDQPFLGEPPIEFWPAGISFQLRGLMTDAAAHLDWWPGRFPGMFLLAAPVRMSKQARYLGAIAGTGESGETARFARIRTMAGAFDSLAHMERTYTRLIGEADEGRILPCPVLGSSPEWRLKFYEEYSPRRDAAIAALFVATCQDALLETLEASHRGIVGRLENFDAYMRVTRSLIHLLLVDVTDLMVLRARLTTSTAAAWAGGVATVATPGGGAVSAWYQSAKLISAALSGPPIDTSGVPQHGLVKQTSDGPRVQDRTGRWWTLAELDGVIGTSRKEIFSVDPLLEKLADLPDTVARFQAAGVKGIEAEFRSVLEEMLKENELRTPRVRDDPSIAFGLASMKESESAAWQDIGAELFGIQKIAHERLRPLFTGDGDVAYVGGMRSLVSSELGKADFWEFFNIFGITAIAIFCPPLAFAIGAVQAVVALDEAYEHRGIQAAMLGGDEILTKAQVEAELWGAAIGAALTFIPEVKGIAGAARSGTRAVVRGEVIEAAEAATRALSRRAAAHLAELAAKNLLEAYVKECLTAYVLSLAIQAAVGRITDAVAHEVSITGHAMGIPSRVGIGDVPLIVSAAFGGVGAVP
jgi:hypothetical protein